MDNKFFSFKRFVTFGLGLGMFMSAASGFAQTVVGTTFGTTNNTTVTSNYTTTITGGTSGPGGTHVLIGGVGKNTVITGNSTNITTTSTTIGVTGGTVKVEGLSTDLNAKKTTVNSIDTVVNSQKTTISGALVVGATGDQRTGQNGIYQMTSGGTTAARIDRNGTLSIIGNGGTEAAPVFNVDGKTGVLTSKANIGTTGNISGSNVTANGTLSVASGSFEVNSSGKALANQGLAVNGAAGLTVGSSFKVAPNGSVTANGIDNNGQKITNVMAGVADTDAVNVGQLQTQSGADRAYTNQQVGTETNRAMAAEAALSKETKQVGAMAMAAAAVAGATPTGDKKTAVSAAVGGYSGQTAVAVGVTHMVTPMFKAFGSLSKVSGGKTGVAVGGSFSF